VISAIQIVFVPSSIEKLLAEKTRESASPGAAVN
jgi:hypothetical protein